MFTVSPDSAERHKHRRPKPQSEDGSGQLRTRRPRPAGRLRDSDRHRSGTARQCKSRSSHRRTQKFRVAVPSNGITRSWFEWFPVHLDYSSSLFLPYRTRVALTSPTATLLRSTAPSTAHVLSAYSIMTILTFLYTDSMVSILKQVHCALPLGNQHRSVTQRSARASRIQTCASRSRSHASRARCASACSIASLACAASRAGSSCFRLASISRARSSACCLSRSPSPRAKCFHISDSPARCSSVCAVSVRPARILSIAPDLSWLANSLAFRASCSTRAATAD